MLCSIFSCDTVKKIQENFQTHGFGTLTVGRTKVWLLARAAHSSLLLKSILYRHLGSHYFGIPSNTSIYTSTLRLFDVKSPRWLNVYSALISAEALLLLYPQENYFDSSATKGISLEIPPFHPNNQGKLRESTAPHRSNQRSSASLAVIALRAWHIETMWDTKTSLEEPPSTRFWDSHDLFVLKILQYLP